ncbi:MAG: hypothetical protein E7265_00665 [Lachnospiraceae bacterium]|nr:hypothetical protein [Lachnospiraceae bacterium]
MKIKKKTILIPFVIVVAILTIVILNKTGSKYEVFISNQYIKKGTVIDADNVDDLFEKKAVNKDMASESLISDRKSIINKKVIADLDNNTLIQQGFLEDKMYSVDKMKSPVTMGIKAADISEIVCGKIREGDIIDISVVEQISGKCIDVIRNVYVAGCYNTDGTLITDDEDVASFINVMVEKDEEQRLNEMLAKGIMKICKVGE